MIRRQMEVLLRLLMFVMLIASAISAKKQILRAQTSESNALESESPAGSQSSAPSQTYEYDIDDYVPYRSDVYDHFSLGLLKEVLLEENKNVIISPFSVKLVLALLSEAAGNNTKTKLELNSTLSDFRSEDNLRSFYKKILTSLKKENPYYTLNLGTKLYAADYVMPQQKYAGVLQSHYDTAIENLKFTDSHASADTINTWCRNITRGALPYIVTPDNLRNTVMLMVNVIYFNGLWRRPFNESFPSAFFRTPSEQVRADYMELTDFFYYFDSANLDAKFLRLPYKGRKFSMFIALPKTKGGVEELIRSLESKQLKTIQWMMEEAKVKVTMPKFKFDFNKDLKETLKKLGIEEIFTDDASLPGLARGSDVTGKLKVSNVYQKAGINVNEKGTEAYASTVVEVENKFGGSSVIEEFNVNRPFLFFIEDETTGNMIFAGKVVDPRQQTVATH